MKHTLSLGCVLITVWLLWSGHYTPLLIGLGVASCLGVLVIASGMGIVDREGAPLQILPGILLYIPWLIVQIVKANIDVSRRILSPDLPISPSVIDVPCTQRSELGRVIHANSITLTPGTVAMEIGDGRIVVHALTREAARETLNGAIDRKVSAIEGDR